MPNFILVVFGKMFFNYSKIKFSNNLIMRNWRFETTEFSLNSFWEQADLYLRILLWKIIFLVVEK